MSASAWEHIRDKGYHRGDSARHHAKVARRGRKQADWEVWRKGRFGHITSVARGRAKTVLEARRCAIAVMFMLEGGR